MTPDPSQPRPAHQPAASPQPQPHLNPQADPIGGSTGYNPADSRSGLGNPKPPRLGQQEEIVQVKKPKRWPMVALVAALIIAGLVTNVMVSHHSGENSGGSIVGASQQANVLTFTGADVDQAATDQAVAELKGGTPEPLLAALPDQVKQEILSGDRKFYRIPATSSDGTSNFQSGDRISVDFNGVPYGTYDLSQPITLNMPLRMGDTVNVHCLSVAQGKTALVVDLATVLNPVRCPPLMAGQSYSLNVRSGNAGQNYSWFQQEAEAGNPVAEYGLGHMYQYGLGVAQNRDTSIHWYQQAAGQNYLDAKAQLQILQANP
jgi:hypothetical protein